MSELKPIIYQIMRAQPGQPLDIPRRGGTEEEQDAFRLTYKRTKFGKCARTMETQNQAMKNAGMKVSSFEYIPQDAGGFYFHFAVNF